MTALHTTTPTPGDHDLSAEFRAAFRHHPGGIAIIAAAGDGGPVGMTASSVASVSVTPTTVLFSLMRSSRSAVGVLEASALSVNLVNADHAELAQIFAAHGAERFTPEQGWEFLPDGTPVLGDAAASLIGHVTHTVELGEAVVVVAEITDVRRGDPGDALVYRNRAFHRLEDRTAD
ncbi:flavin reductase family protein [Brevibacterium yomogidense]|uniref:flavin reductase family protein n=1 Tax=Brevibacterium yomogidense TaxID=946573 RepID=UPI001E5B7D00|nr:flavin reductase family protein [Brevibacterium yomogidense]